MKKQLYRIDEVAEILGVCRATIYNLLDEGYLKGHNRQPGTRGGQRITRQSIEEYIKIYELNPIKT